MNEKLSRSSKTANVHKGVVMLVKDWICPVLVHLLQAPAAAAGSALLPIRVRRDVVEADDRVFEVPGIVDRIPEKPEHVSGRHVVVVVHEGVESGLKRVLIRLTQTVLIKLVLPKA